MLLSWSVWLGTLILLLVGNPSKLASALMMLAGFVPYVVCIQVIEPWLINRERAANPEATDC